MTVSSALYKDFIRESSSINNSEVYENDKVSGVATGVLASSHLTKEDRAAITLQKITRGYLVRKAFLSRDIYQSFVALWKKTKRALPMSAAKGGKTCVWLPRDVPEIVLKASGRQSAIGRFHQMLFAHSVLRSQGSKHLIIPKARLFEDYLIEERLPITTDHFHNMAIYSKEPRIFDDAVREMTRLFSKAYLGDLLTYKVDPLSQIVGDSIRYDNLPLYIVEENGKRKGKIGLIDLEHLNPKPSPKGLETLARIFPYHVDLIIEEAIKLKMDIDQSVIQAAADRGMQFLQKGYLSHLEWLKAKNNIMDVWAKVTRLERTDDHHVRFISHLPLKIEPDRMAILTQIVERELLKLNKGENDVYLWRGLGYENAPKDFLAQDPQKVAQELACAICPKIIERLNHCIMKYQGNKLHQIGGEIRSESNIIMLRSPILTHSELDKGISRLLLKHPHVSLKGFFSGEESRYMTVQLVHYVVEELVQGGEFFSFDPGYYSGEHQLFWIRY